MATIIESQNAIKLEFTSLFEVEELEERMEFRIWHVVPEEPPYPSVLPPDANS